jgi:predicted CxxxxCH...CXXCH cytochrome family protein
VVQPGGKEERNIGSAENAEKLRKWVAVDSLALAQPTVHPIGWLDPASSNFHGKKIRADGWSFGTCTPCHGDDYAGGITKRACTVCHAGSPEGCGTCHGGPDNAAPPRDLTGARVTSARGVGAHQTHVTEGKITKALDCTECHVKPQTVTDTGHIDTDLPAEVIFGTFAKGEGTEKGTKALPAWDGASSTCRNTYCHGAFTNGNQDYAPAWTQPKSDTEVCGTCHGLPPPSPHPPVVVGILDCVNCHPKVTDKDRLIIDRGFHINGKVELF